nr:MAG TPA: hypothetical protein [Caudoviricetes sp.]DAI24936.1 MAG TPA: hypothetical protein [Caudoviricetes sp.]DAN74790.1 MAG TPA: hypothetical protein [Caudoviricetes sp.]
MVTNYENGTFVPSLAGAKSASTDPFSCSLSRSFMLMTFTAISLITLPPSLFSTVSLFPVCLINSRLIAQAEKAFLENPLFFKRFSRGFG